MHALVRRWLHALLLAATLATQTLGLVHQVSHERGDPGRAAVHAALEDAFALDDEGVSCELFDQLAQGGAAAWDAVPAASCASHLRLPVAQAPRESGSAASFDARAPPAA